MHLALNFPRIDPTRGGAETYVVDLCKSLVRAGHSVDLYAESWKEGSLPPEVRCIAIAAPGRNRRAQIWNFARNSAATIDQARYDCTVGFINTYAHDVIIPQGGVHGGSMRANSLRFKSPLVRRLYLVGKMLDPKYFVYRAIERMQYSPERQTRVIAVSNMVRRAHPDAAPRSPFLDSCGAQRHRRRASQGRSARGGPVRFPQPSGAGTVRPGRPVRGAQLRTEGLEAATPALGAEIAQVHGPYTCWSAAAAAPTRYRRMARALGIEETVHFLGYHDDIRECFASSDFFVMPSYYDPCSLVVLEALASGLPVITTAQNGASELYRDGQEGYVLTSPDAQGELIAALDHMTDDMLRQAMSARAARLGALQSFDCHVAALVKVFRRGGVGPDQPQWAR